MGLTHIHTGIDAVFAFHVLVVVGPIGEMVIAFDARIRSFAGVLTAMRLRDEAYDEIRNYCRIVQKYENA